MYRNAKTGRKTRKGDSRHRETVAHTHIYIYIYREAEDKEKAEKKHDEDVKLWKDSIHELKEELQNQLSAPKKS